MEQQLQRQKRQVPQPQTRSVQKLQLTAAHSESVQRWRQPGVVLVLQLLQQDRGAGMAEEEEQP